MASADSMAALPNFDPGVGTVWGGFVDHDVRWLQRSLNRLGHCAGREDGVWGDRTRRGLESFLEARGYPVTGFTVRPPNRLMLILAASGALQSARLPTTSACPETGVPAGRDHAALPPEFMQEVARGTVNRIAPWAYAAIIGGGLLIATAGYLLLRKRKKRRR